MTWSTRRGLWLVWWLCVGLVTGLTGAIVAVSMLSSRDRISLAGGVAVFVVVVVSWAAVCLWLGRRWWRWARHDRQAAREERVLVVYGSRRGGTAQLAGSIANHLTSAGIPVDVRTASDVACLAGYRAVLIGGALYRDRWHPDARRFVRRHAAELRARPVWLFASGPLAALASPHERAPTATVAAAASRIGARDVATFGGRLEDRDPSGATARRMVARGRGGDFRDPQQIEDWAVSIAHDLERVDADGASGVWSEAGTR